MPYTPWQDADTMLNAWTRHKEQQARLALQSCVVCRFWRHTTYCAQHRVYVCAVHAPSHARAAHAQRASRKETSHGTEKA